MTKRKRRRRRVPPEPKPYSSKDGVTQSLLSKWVHCRQDARYYLDGLRERTTKESLAFGSLWHDMLEGLNRGIKDGSVDQDGVETFFHGRVKAFRAKAAKWSSPVEPQTLETCVAKASALFPTYCTRYEDDFDPSLHVSVEGVFDVDWRGYRLRGRIDELRLAKAGLKSLWVQETKTMGVIDKSLASALTFDFQNLFYRLAAGIIVKPKRVAGIIYNVIRRPGHKPKAGEPLPAYALRLAAMVAKDPDHFFKRYEINFSPADVERFERELEWKLKEFHSWVRGEMPTYGDSKSCRGRWTCNFLDACSEGDVGGYARGGRLFEELEE